MPKCYSCDRSGRTFPYKTVNLCARCLEEAKEDAQEKIGAS